MWITKPKNASINLMSSWQKTILFSLAFVAVFFSPTVSAQSTLSEQLEAVKQQVNSLQQQILQRTDSIADPSPKTLIISTNLAYGDSGPAVQRLQQLLNQVLETPVSTTGPGSVGQESMYFGAKTLEAVKRFQDRYALDVLAPTGLTKPTGFVGERTRAKLNQLTNSDQKISVESKDSSPTIFSSDDELEELRSQVVFDKWELTEEDKRKIVQSVPAELRSQYFPGYATDQRGQNNESTPENILEREYQRLLEQQSSAIEMFKFLAFIELLKQPTVFLGNSLATIFSPAKTAEAQGFSVFGGRISTVTPCTCNPPALMVTVAGPRPASVVYFPGVTRKSPPTPPSISANTIGNYVNFGVCLVGAPPACSSTVTQGTIILMGSNR